MDWQFFWRREGVIATELLLVDDESTVMDRWSTADELDHSVFEALADAVGRDTVTGKLIEITLEEATTRTCGHA